MRLSICCCFLLVTTGWGAQVLQQLLPPGHPCTEFSYRQHLDINTVLDLLCHYIPDSNSCSWSLKHTHICWLCVSSSGCVFTISFPVRNVIWIRTYSHRFLEILIFEIKMILNFILTASTIEDSIKVVYIYTPCFHVTIYFEIKQGEVRWSCWPTLRIATVNLSVKELFIHCTLPRIC